MKHAKYWIIIGASLLVLTGLTGQSNAGVNIGIGINLPPAYVVAAPPDVVEIPGTYVYAVPDPAVNILFYHGYWWRPYEGHWYRSARYDRGWAYVRSERVPRAVIDLPHDYHNHFGNGPRIAHDDLRRNWRGWERDRHWDRHEDHRDSRNDRGDHGHHGEGHHGDRY